MKSAQTRERPSERIVRRSFIGRTVAVILLGIGATRSFGVDAQTARSMSLIDLAELPRTLDPELSPDGRFVIYALSHADWKLDRPVWNLWRQEVGGGPPVRLTYGDTLVPAFTRWSPDGRTILFEQDTPQVYLMAADGGEPRALTHHATAVSYPTWSPDSTAVYFLAADARTAEERERDRLRDDVYAYDENYKHRQLWKVVVSTGDEQAITSGDSSVVSYHLSRDGRRIAFERAPTPLAADAYRGEVWTMDADGGNARAITNNAVEELEPELSPDNSQVLFLAGANPQLESYYNQNLFIVPAAGGTPRAVLPDFPYEFDRATWLPDGRSILAVVNMGVHSEVFRVDVAGRTFTQLTDGAHAIPSAPAPAWSVEPRAGKVTFLFDEPTRFGDAWVMALTGGAPVRVTGVYDTLGARFALPRQEKFEWKGADGAKVEGLLFYPAGYQTGTRYPLVVQMHGGPYESDKFGAGAGLFQSFFPTLAGKGYVVLRPNYRGSAGYGNAAYRDVVGHYFNNMHLDVIAGVDALVAMGVADPDRLVLMGWSAGAHLTNKLITFTNRFKVASSGAGAADFVSFYAQTDVRANRTAWFGGTPWQKDAPIEAFWSHSPLKDVANVTTPTLFFAGENDARVPLPQSVEMYRALKSNGVATELYVAPREPHMWGALRHLLFKDNAELEWFERYAGGRAYTWEHAP